MADKETSSRMSFPSTPQPSNSNRVPDYILLLIAIGVLPAGLTALFNLIQNPTLAVMLFVLSELVILAFGFMGGVWQRLQARWTERLADWVDGLLVTYLSGYRKRYLEYIVYQHRSFDVRGLTTQGVYTLELEHVYVELSVDAKTIDIDSSNPVRPLSSKIIESSHPIWEYITSQALQRQHFAIIGAPGSGKTTLLKHMALILAANQKRQSKYRLPHKLPILLFLRDHVNSIKHDPNFSLVQAVTDRLAALQAPLPPAHWFQNRLDKGECLIMLDGLDEVADPEVRKSVVHWVERLMIAHAKNRFVVTSRPYGYRSNPISGVAVLEVQPFSMTQVEQFLHSWYLSNEIMSNQKDDPGVRMIAQSGALDLLKRIRANWALLDLVVNPLLLTMIANVHRYRSSLPGRRVELYAEIQEVFLGKRQLARGLESDLTPSQKQRVLQALAYHLMAIKKREISVAEALEVIGLPLLAVAPHYDGKDFLEAIESSSGLLLERETGIYSFAHLSFQEYLASVHIHENHLQKELIAQVGDTWWHETILLFCAQADASSLIEACLIDDIPAVITLKLAMECIEEAREVQPTVRKRYSEVIGKSIESDDLERQHVIADALIEIRLSRLMRVNERVLIDRSPITCLEFQSFLDSLVDFDSANIIRRKELTSLMRERSWFNRLDEICPRHWQAYRFPQGHGTSPATGVSAEAASRFCEWLSKSTSSSEWRYRLVTTTEFDKYPLEGNLGDVLGYWVLSDEKDGKLDFQWVGPTRPKNPSAEFVIRKATEDVNLGLEQFSYKLHTLETRHFNYASLARHIFDNTLAAHELKTVIEQVCRSAIERAINRPLFLELRFEAPEGLRTNTPSSSPIVDQIVRTLEMREPPPLGDPMKQYRHKPLEMATDLSRAHFTLTEAGKVPDLLRVCALLMGLLLVAQSLSNNDLSEGQKWSDHFLDFYIDVLRLEERLKGNASAFEGMRIVKEYTPGRR